MRKGEGVISLANREAECWDEWRRTRSPEALNALVSHYAIWAEYLADRHFPGIDRELMVSACLVGVWEAVEGFDPERGVRFRTFAWRRAIGSMRDALRDVDYLSRLQRVRLRARSQARDAFAAREGHEPDADELAGELGISLANFKTLYEGTDRQPPLSLSQPVGGDTFSPMYAGDIVEDPRSAERSPQERERFWRKVTHCLNGRERTVILRHYRDGVKVNDLALEMGISIPLTWHLLHRARCRIRLYVPKEELV
jgi:RNA polymerase sigma factor FliA